MMRKKILVATNNPGKLEEITQILEDYQFIVLKDINCKMEVNENEETFEGNAKKKAKEIGDLTNMPCIADDSGLCIEALDGWPGVHTARFLGKDATQKQRNEEILERMTGLEKGRRKAKVVCVMAYYEKGEFVVSRGEVIGKIAERPKGENGFGFDPIFELENGKTYGELSRKEKNAISHRKMALESLQKQLTNK